MTKSENCHHLLSFSAGPEQWRVTSAFAPVFQQLFPQGLAPILPEARLLKQGSRKSVYLFHHTSAEGRKKYYVKVYRHLGLLNRVISLLKTPRGLHEFRVGIVIAARGIPAMVPCAGGARRRCRIASESYFITEEVEQTENLAGVLLENPSRTPFTARDRFTLAKRLGALIRVMHERGIFQEDLALNNFLVGVGAHNRGSLYLIDFERISLHDTVSPVRQEWVLSKLNRLGREVSLSQRLRFLHAFRPDLKKEEIKTLARTIDAATTRRLQQDMLHRSANTYTTVGYRSFNERGYQGYARRAENLNELLELIAQGPEAEDPATKSVTLRREPDLVTLLRFPDRREAERHWKFLWGLKTGRVPLAAPLAMIHSTKAPGASWIVLPAPNDAPILADILRTAPHAAERDILERLAAGIIHRLHQLNVSVKGLSLDAFLVTRDWRGRPCLHLAKPERLTIIHKITDTQAYQELTAMRALFSSSP
nr:hypothetical protein [Deltaproteobacteria bacterium]